MEDFKDDFKEDLLIILPVHMWASFIESLRVGAKEIVSQRA